MNQSINQQSISRTAHLPLKIMRNKYFSMNQVCSDEWKHETVCILIQNEAINLVQREISINVKWAQILPPFFTHYFVLDLEIFYSCLAIIGTFSLFTHIDLKWFDNNLQFVYLKQNSYENIINDTLVEKIWIPSYDFAFVDSQVKSNFNLICKYKITCRKQSSKDLWFQGWVIHLSVEILMNSIL